MDENCFWIRWWKIIGYLLAFFTVTSTACVMHDSATIARMVEHGAHPIDAYCSVSSARSNTICTVRGTHR